MGVRGELQALETAVRRRYPVDAVQAAKTVNAFLGSTDPRIALRAASIAAMMESQNQKDEHKAIDVSIHLDHNRLSQVAAELGIDPHLIAGPKDEAGGDTESIGDGQAD